MLSGIGSLTEEGHMECTIWHPSFIPFGRKGMPQQRNQREREKRKRKSNYNAGGIPQRSKLPKHFLGNVNFAVGERKD